MIKVRFLEGCYLFSTAKSYDPNDITELDEKQASKLFKRGVVDILKDEEYIDEEEHQMNLDEKTVPELRVIADEKNITHSSLKKAELIKAIEEVL